GHVSGRTTTGRSCCHARPGSGGLPMSARLAVLALFVGAALLILLWGMPPEPSWRLPPATDEEQKAGLQQRLGNLERFHAGKSFERWPKHDREEYRLLQEALRERDQ